MKGANISTILTYPIAAAECNGVQPFSLSVIIKNENNAQIEITELGKR